jgi:hypothetical protein
MNKQIKLLVEQATTIHEYGWGASYENFDKEKFAQLIVLKCAEIADTAEPFLASDLIRQHFGVE